MFLPVFNFPVLSRSEVVLSSPQSYINMCHGLKCLSVQQRTLQRDYHQPR